MNKNRKMYQGGQGGREESNLMPKNKASLTSLLPPCYLPDCPVTSLLQGGASGR